MASYNLPTYNGSDDLKQIKSYLIRLNDALKYTLSNIDEENMSSSAAEAVSAALRARAISEELRSSVNLSSGKTEENGGYVSMGGVNIAYGTVTPSFSESVLAKGVATSPLNIRSAPSTSAGVLGLIPQYAEADITEISNGWARVNYGSIEGWSSTAYLRITYCSASSSSSAAVVALPVIFSDGYSVTLTPEGAPKSGFACFVSDKTGGSFKININNGSSPLIINWTAIGLRT